MLCNKYMQACIAQIVPSSLSFSTRLYFFDAIEIQLSYLIIFCTLPLNKVLRRILEMCSAGVLIVSPV